MEELKRIVITEEARRRWRAGHYQVEDGGASLFECDDYRMEERYAARHLRPRNRKTPQGPLDEERSKPRRIVDSLKAQEAGDWSVAAWCRAVARIAALARREADTLGRRQPATERLLCDARDYLRADAFLQWARRVRSATDAHPRPGLEGAFDLATKWLLLELDYEVFFGDVLSHAEPKFDRAVREGDTALAEAVLETTREVILRCLDGEEVGWDDVDDRPAALAQAPLVVVPPRRACEPLPKHPYAGTPQYKQARKAAADIEEEAVWHQAREVFGEGLGAVIGAKPHAYVPAHRHHRGTKNPDTAEQRLLAQCPRRTIEELRKVASARGRPSAQVRATRAALVDAIYHIRNRQTATNEALAEALSCNVSTIHRLRESARRGDLADVA